nr:RagB/SusD family nutrient uptake outer membrane protein [Flavisolibacter sp.]
MNFIKYSILLLLVVLVNSSCKKYVDIPPPTNQLVQQLVFSDDKTATATVAGLYSRLNAFNSSFGNSLGNFLPAFSADEFRYILNAASFDEFAQHSISSSNTNIKSLWDNPYAYIYHANAILEGLNKAPNVSAATKTQLAGEAKFIRAFCYFYLVNYFGDVPLVMNTDFAVNTSLPRSPSAEVYAAVIKDLTEAQAELNINYPSAERTRANKAVA